MPRKLPWLKSSNTAQATRLATLSNPRVKRRKLADAGSDADDADGMPPRRTGPPNTRFLPPPTEQPANIPMIEGFGHDDRFRMVEDEFLDTAKKFTQHLHAAEYQRMKKATKSQNEETIGSILRPVTLKMPDETRRKVESVARARKQATTIQKLLGKHAQGSGSDEESNGNRSTWVGTTLYGLMESPRRSTAALSKVAKIRVPTRAAAGFREARSQRSHHLHTSDLTSPDPGISAVKRPKSPMATTGESSSSEDDDLDAPVRARKVQSTNQPINHHNKSMSLSAHQGAKGNESDSVHVPYEAKRSEVKLVNMEEISSDTSKAARERIAKRLEQAKLRESRQKAKELDIIPKFLS